MKIIKKAVLDMNTMQWIPALEESYEYSGPLALADRAAQSAASTAGKTAGGLAGQQGAEAAGEQAVLNPFFQREMTAQHLYTPGQEGELLTAAGAGTGAIAGAEQAGLERNAATTNNATALTKGLQDAAMQRMKGNAGLAEGVAAQDVMGAKQLNQQGAAGEAGLFNTNTDAQLKAMGLQTNDINTQIEAGKGGWLQNMNATIASLANAAHVVRG
jgi:hypothetical protein